MARFSGMQYCKTDLIATKGIVFVKCAAAAAAACRCRCPRFGCCC